MDLCSRLVELRKENGYTRESLANELGISKYTLRNYELGSTEPGHSFLIKIANFFNVSIDYIMGVTNERERTSSYQLKSSEHEHIKKYSLLDDFGRETVDIILNRELSRVQQLDRASIQSHSKPAALRIYTYLNKIACAGSGFYFEDIPTDIVEAPYMEGADFVIGVSGDSMEPTYHDGDMVYVEQRQVIDIGDIGIFFHNNECLIKEAGESGLISHNPKYEMIPGSEDIRCIGRVLGKVPDRVENSDNNNSFELRLANREFKKALESEKAVGKSGKTG